MATNLNELSDMLTALRQEVARLGERLAALEGHAPPKPPQPAPPAEKPAAGISEETLVVISAAIAAFLGKRPRIRQIRLVGGESWAQHGRATIQASHAYSVQHR